MYLMTNNSMFKVSSAFFAVLQAKNQTSQNILYNRFIDTLSLALRHLPIDVYYEIDEIIMEELERRLEVIKF